MYKVYFIENPDAEDEIIHEIGAVDSDDIYDVYMFIADFAHEHRWINCFMIPCPDEEDDNLMYVDILTVPHFFVIERLFN